MLVILRIARKKMSSSFEVLELIMRNCKTYLLLVSGEVRLIYNLRSLVRLEKVTVGGGVVVGASFREINHQ